MSDCISASGCYVFGGVKGLLYFEVAVVPCRPHHRCYCSKPHCIAQGLMHPQKVATAINAASLFWSRKYFLFSRAKTPVMFGGIWVKQHLVNIAISIFGLWRPFKPKQKPKLESIIKMPREPQIMTIFLSRLYNINWPSYGKFKISLIYWPGEVIDDVMGMWHITWTTRHPNLNSCKIKFVWHQSLILKSSR